jgi:hypothetical protein
VTQTRLSAQFWLRVYSGICLIYLYWDEELLLRLGRCYNLSLGSLVQMPKLNDLSISDEFSGLTDWLHGFLVTRTYQFLAFSTLRYIPWLKAQNAGELIPSTFSWQPVKDRVVFSEEKSNITVSFFLLHHTPVIWSDVIMIYPTVFTACHFARNIMRASWILSTRIQKEVSVRQISVNLVSVLNWTRANLWCSEFWPERNAHGHSPFSI